MHKLQLSLELILYQYYLNTLRTFDGILIHESVDKPLLYSCDLDQTREAGGAEFMLQPTLQRNQLPRGPPAVTAVTVFVFL